MKQRRTRKLTAADVAFIRRRRAAGVKLVELARYVYGCSSNALTYRLKTLNADTRPPGFRA